MEQSESETASGPWIYKDPDGRRYLVQVVPMEHDPTVEASRPVIHSTALSGYDGRTRS